MSKFLFAPFMMNLGESQRLSKLARFLFEQGHEIHVIGERHYSFLFDNDAYVVHHCSEDEKIYSKERYASFFSLSTDFNFLSEEEIESICSIEREILRKERFDAVITGYRLSIITSCRLEKTPLIWIISGATHINEIVKNAEGLLPKGRMKRGNSQLSAKFIEKLITSYSSNVKNWNNYLKKHQGLPFNNALEMFSGDLNLVADYSQFYDFQEDSCYKSIGPILIDQVGFCNHIEKGNKKILLSFGTSFKVSWVEEFLKTLPTDYQYVLTTCGEELKIPGPHVEVVDFVDFEMVAPDIKFAIIHGGQGTVYAMASQAIPFIGIPFFNEQFWNIKKFSQLNCAYLINDSNNLKIEEAINVLDQNYSMFKNNIVELSHNIKNESEQSLKNAEVEIDKFIKSRKDQLRHCL
jgi:hypothetical protein